MYVCGGVVPTMHVPACVLPVHVRACMYVYARRACACVHRPPMQATWSLCSALFFREFGTYAYTYPMQATWSLCSITKGALFFREFGTYEAPHMAAFLVGVAVTLLGVYVLSSQPVKTRQQQPVNEPVSIDIVRPGAHVNSHLSRRVLFSAVVGGGGRRVRPASPGMEEADHQAPNGNASEPVCA